MEILTFTMVFFADRLSKKWARDNLANGEIKAAVGNRLYFTRLENSGFSKGIMSGRPCAVKKVSGLALLAAFIYAAFGLKGAPKAARLGYFAMLGGGFSNFYDRMIKGSVTDFICFKKEGKKTVFNIADFFIFAGAAIVIGSELIEGNFYHLKSK